MSEILAVSYTNGSASAQITSAPTKVYGVVVNSHTSGTIRFNDGTGNTATAGTKATGVLTGSGVFSNNQTVTIGTVTYTMKTTLTGAPYEVLIGANLAASLDNLKEAINAGTGEGTVFGTGTLANPHVVATTNTDTAQTVEAREVGTRFNTVATTETGANASWGAATLTGGVEPNFLVLNTITLAAGPQILTFPAPIQFRSGVYLTVGGTINFTVLHA
jgi:hypothetical protein